MAPRAVLVAVVVLTLVGCGSADEGDDPVATAQRELSEANDALEEANGSLEDAGETFCDASVQYLEAVDGYGGIVTDAEATVGDVTTAGADLTEPHDEVTSSADDVHRAQEDVAAAVQQVTDAQAALVEAQGGSSSTSQGPTTSTTAPLVSDVEVARAEQANADLVAAFEGIDESTPLSEATQEVNAAAVAVEVAWMQVFASAGCLSDDEHTQVVIGVADYTRTLQSALTTAGYDVGEVDGVYGPDTVAAVQDLQTDAGLPVTGLVDRATAEALDEALAAASGDAATAELAHTAALQTVLTLTGHWTGPIDGTWTEALTAALQEFQADLGVAQTGVVDPATIGAAQRALTEARSPASPTTTDRGPAETVTSTVPP